jgi:hypothetical protein
MQSKLILKQNGMESNFFPYTHLWTKPKDVEHVIIQIKTEGIILHSYKCSIEFYLSYVT